MRSVRLTPELDERVRDAAAQEGASVSEFLRRAAAERADHVLADRPSERLEDLIGVVRSKGGRATRTGAAFGDELARKRQAP